MFPWEDLWWRLMEVVIEALVVRWELGLGPEDILLHSA